VDSLPPPPPAVATYAHAPGDIYPRGAQERELCARASHPDWLYLAGLGLLDGGAIYAGSTDLFKFHFDPWVSMVGPALIGVTWGATIGGAWLALPKCSPEWVDEAAREGDVRAAWPMAISLALLAGATAPIVYGIAIGVGDLPDDWTDFNRAIHAVVAGVTGFGGALLPYLIPPRTWSAARELERIRLGTDGRGGWFLGYSARF
jgi:hypothetical protein